MQKVDRAVLAAFERQLLGPGMVDEIIAAASAKATPASSGLQQDRNALARGLDRVEGEIRNLTAAIAQGGNLNSLLKALEEREADRDRLRHQLASAEQAERKVVASPTKLREQLEERMADWRGVLQRQAPTARQIIKKLLVGPLRFTPKQDEDGTRYYEFEGEGTLAKILANVTHSFLVASPTGFDDLYTVRLTRWAPWKRAA